MDTKLYSALCKAARLKIEADKADNAAYDKLDSTDVSPDASDEELEALVDPVARNEAERLQREYNETMAIYAADADLRNEMTCWLVDVSGPQEPKWAKKDMPTEEEWLEAVSGQTCTLSAKIYDFIEDSGFAIHDAGAGSGGWDIGVFCDGPDSAKLCTLLRDKFHVEIDSGAVTVALKFWAWDFKELLDESVIEEWAFKKAAN